LGAGPAGAEPSAGATPALKPPVPPRASALQKLPDTHTQITTPDGWTIRIDLTGVTVSPVPNLAETPFTREAFWSGTATGRILGKGKTNVDSAQIKLQMQVGCQADVSSGANLSLSSDPNYYADPSLSIGGGEPPTAGLNPEPGIDLDGSIGTTLKPGTINTQDIATRKLQTKIGWTSLRHVEAKIDACAGPVTIRLAAGLSISTINGDNTIFTYSRPAWM
ncbi:MspA family porin, partial [Tsukamurella soli]